MSNTKITSIDLNIGDSYFGDLNKAKEIVMNLKKLGVSDLKVTGDRVCLYPFLEELLAYIKELELNVGVLSNNHGYKNTDVNRIRRYVDYLETVLYGVDSFEHDRILKSNGSYDELVSNLLGYDFCKSSNQKLGVYVDLVNGNYDKIFQTILNFRNSGISIDYALIRRYAPFVSENRNPILTPQQMNESFEDIKRINDELNIDAKMVGDLSLWTIPSVYHKYIKNNTLSLNKFICDIDGNLYVDKKGKVLELGNVLEASPLILFDECLDERKISSKVKRKAM